MKIGAATVCHNELISSIRFADSRLDCVTVRATVPGMPPSADRTFVGRTVSALQRPTAWAVIPSPSVTVAVVRW